MNTARQKPQPHGARPVPGRSGHGSTGALEPSSRLVIFMRCEPGRLALRIPRRKPVNFHNCSTASLKRLTRPNPKLQPFHIIPICVHPCPSVVSTAFLWPFCSALPLSLIHNHDLLPHLARQARGQPFNFIDRTERHRVVEALHIKRRDLADQRQHLTAIV
jgi:hypothetical protein